VLFFMAGLLGDCASGLLLLREDRWQIFLLHFPCALLWTAGVNLLARREEQVFFLPNKWGMSALLLGCGTFPGCGSCMCSIAFFVTRYLFSPSAAQDSSFASLEAEAETPWLDLASLSESAVLPLVEELYEGDTEVRRAVVAKLHRQFHPDTTPLLRQLLSDSHAEIRSDASIALAQLEEELSRELHLAFAAWNANPADCACTLSLAEAYYRYAASNVLDAMSQRFYLGLARDLLLKSISRATTDAAQLWLKLACVRQKLGEFPQALQDALQAYQLQPACSDALILALELAFRTHDWDVLLTLSDNGVQSMPASTDKFVAIRSLQWWNVEACGGVLHE
jgi:tetratricopeptide (TPR) repeat protein